MKRAHAEQPERNRPQTRAPFTRSGFAPSDATPNESPLIAAIAFERRGLCPPIQEILQRCPEPDLRRTST